MPRYYNMLKSSNRNGKHENYTENAQAPSANYVLVFKLEARVEKPWYFKDIKMRGLLSLWHDIKTITLMTVEAPTPDSAPIESSVPTDNIYTV